MADSTTPAWGLTKPEVGSSRDTWGAKLNADWDQVDAIMLALTPIGAVMDFASTFAPYGWLLCDGSIYPISTYPKLAAVLGGIYGGDGTTTFAVPDCRGRVTAGVGTTTDLGGYLSGFSLGQKYGFYQFTISATYLPSVAVTIDAAGNHGHTGWTDGQGLHAHNGYTDAQGNHAHGYSAVSSAPGAALTNVGVVAANYSAAWNTAAAGNHQHNIQTTSDGSHSHTIWADYAGTHTHTGSIAGGGYPIPLMQPLIAFNKIIFAGPPGFTTLSSPIPGAPARLASPMRGPG